MKRGCATSDCTSVRTASSARSGFISGSQPTVEISGASAMTWLPYSPNGREVGSGGGMNNAETVAARFSREFKWS